MIRVAHLITDLSVGGAEMMLLRLVEKMDERSFSSLVISLTDIGPVGESIRKLGIPVEALGMQFGRPSPIAIAKLVGLLRSFGPQVVQSWLYHSDLLATLATGLSRKPGLLWNLRCSDMDLTRYSRLTRWVVGACARLSHVPDVVVSNSDAGRRYHTGLGYRPKRWEVIPNGFDLDRFRPDLVARARLRAELGVPAEALLVGLVARHDPMKDHETFLRAAAQLRRSHSEVHFVLCGTRVTMENPALSGWVRDLGLEGAAHLLGERHDVPVLTAALDIACSSSISEGFPTAVGEAMACGVPCVVTDAGDSAALLGDAGRVVPARDPASLAKAIDGLVALGPPGRGEMGVLGRDRIERRYSLPAVVSRYEKLYREIALKCAE